jgi:hypothetical protein
MRATPNNAQNGLIALLFAVKLATFLSRHVLQVLIWTDGRKGDKSKKGGFNREVVSFGANGTMNNVRLREEGGRKRGGGTLRGGEVVVVWPLIYTSEDWGRVSMWISDRRRSVLYMAVSGQTGISRGTALASLARQPRVGGAALCIIDSIFRHAATALHPHSRQLFVFFFTCEFCFYLFQN